MATALLAGRAEPGCSQPREQRGWGGCLRGWACEAPPAAQWVGKERRGSACSLFPFPLFWAWEGGRGACRFQEEQGLGEMKPVILEVEELLGGDLWPEEPSVWSFNLQFTTEGTPQRCRHPDLSAPPLDRTPGW